ncbi:MAG: hypothetical protein WD042_08895 [Phycisphaeraceae bacterium]
MPNTTINTSQSQVDKAGVYQLSPGDYRLIVKLQPDDNGHLVTYELHAPVSDALIVSGDAGAASARWFLFWSVDHELWVHSSDIGTFIWQKDPNLGYQRHTVTGGLEVRRMPDMVFDSLPESLKRRWLPVRIAP